jgi:peptidyl-prolyl cis-trans isomerase B (cyclophilin B)
MSQSKSNRPGQSRAGSASQSKQGARSTTGQTSTRSTSGTRSVVKRPVQQAPPASGFQARMDRMFPPFSARRYIALWVAFAALVVVVFLILLRPWASGQASVPAASTTTSCSIPGAAGKYLAIETDKGCIVAKLYTDPSDGVSKTIANFEEKARSGYFNGLTFHRVEDWVIQGGDPAGNGTGGGTMLSEYNQIPFEIGSLGVARGMDLSLNNDSQFFIVKADSPHLNGQYTNWGHVLEGMEAVSQIKVGDKINKLTIETRE